MEERLYKKIRRLRKSKVLSQTEFGKLIGVSRQTVSKWERGLIEPNGENIQTICRIFNLSVEAFLEGDLSLITTISTENPPREENDSEGVEAAEEVACADTIKESEHQENVTSIIQEAVREERSKSPEKIERSKRSARVLYASVIGGGLLIIGFVLITIIFGINAFAYHGFTRVYTSWAELEVFYIALFLTIVLLILEIILIIKILKTKKQKKDINWSKSNK